MPDFSEESFHFGRDGERAYMDYSLKNNRIMVEVGALREKLGSGAPMIYLPKEYQGKEKLISPDFLTVNAQAMFSAAPASWRDAHFTWTAENMWKYPFLWNEVKSKRGCSWSKILKRWQTGIDGYQLLHYRRVQDTSNIPVILFFLQLDDATAQHDAPHWAGVCPTGIYACPVSQSPDMTHPQDKSTDVWKPLPVERARMVYWNIDRLISIATSEEMMSISKVKDILAVKSASPIEILKRVQENASSGGMQV